MNAHMPPTDAELALCKIEDLYADAFAGLQIVDYLIENGQKELAYRATNTVFDALRKIQEVVISTRKEASQ